MATSVWIRQRTRAALIAALAGALTVSGCASIPESSSPQPIGSVPFSAPTSRVPRPIPGMAPEALVRAFLKASADPARRHLAARQFLTRNASDKWDDQQSAVILDSINVLSDERSQGRIRVRVNGESAGLLAPNGQLVAQGGRAETTLTLVQEGGEWRIDGPLPAGVMMDRSQFTASYASHNLYFLSKDGNSVVPDPRWLYKDAGQLPDQLLGLLTAGPIDDLNGAVNNQFSGDAGVRGAVSRVGNGAIKVTLGGMTSLSGDDRQRLAAQIVWTLAEAKVNGPYIIEADGAPLVEDRRNGWTTRDVEHWDPSPTPDNSRGLLAIQQGSLVTVQGNSAPRLGGQLGQSNSVLSAALSANGNSVATVNRGGEPQSDTAQTLQIGNYGGSATESERANTLTRPSFGAGEDEVWTVRNGRDIVLLRHPSRDGQAWISSPVGSDALRGVVEGQITELQVSPDGSRAAMIVSGRVVIAAIARADDGAVRLVGARAAAYNLGSPALSLDWLSGDTIVLSRNSSESPVVQLPINGSPAVGLPSGNLSPPVTAVVADENTIYVADSRGVLRLGSTNNQPDQYWSEVQPLMGSRAIPIVQQ